MQLHSFPVGCKTEKVSKDIGNSISTYIHSDRRNFYLLWSEYMHIRVTINVLKRKVQVKVPKASQEWVLFKYEKLSTLCYFCGKIGHSN